MHRATKQTAMLVILITVVAILALSLLYREHKGTDDINSAKPSSSKLYTSEATDKVSISDMAFSPQSVTVRAGTTVTWTNEDPIQHTVVSDGQLGPNSQNLNQGETYSYTFTQPGTYRYHCSIHTDMTGTVIVR